MLISCSDYWKKFAEELVKLTNLKHNSNLLDVGTGPGTCLLAAFHKLKDNTQFIGIDRNVDNIDQTLNNFHDLGIRNVQFHNMDAINLKFENDSFDNVTCGFLGFWDDFDFESNQIIRETTKMKEMYRVLKPGGEVAISTWAYQQDIETARELLQRYLRDNNIMKSNEIEKLFISYSKETTEGFKILMEDAKFKNIKIQVKDFKINYKTSEEWWEKMKQVAWIMRHTLNNNPSKLKDLKKYTLPQGIESFESEGKYVFKKSVIFGIGSK